MAEDTSTQTKKKLDQKSKTTSTTTTTTKDAKEDRKRKRDEKQRQKQQLLDKIPKRDKDGISYTKQQIRRMVKRVKRGLPPVPTPEEEAALRQQEAQLKREEELELAGMIYQRDDDKNNVNDDDDDEEDDDDEVGGGSNDNEEDNTEENHQSAEDDDENDKEEDQENGYEQDDIQRSASKKRRLSKKPVPSDYVCQACKNKHNFPHWIYDCPDKQTIKGINRVAAGKVQQQQQSQSGSSVNAPSAKKVFVSGLLFQAKVQDVKAIFKQCGKITSCKLLTFPDSGRCKGQAFVVFETEESAKKALAMNGTKISADAEEDDDGAADKPSKHKKTKAASPTKKRELELKVTKVKSRLFTKKATK